MNKFCSECGAKLAPGDRFCAECGAMVGEAAAPAAPASPAPIRAEAPPPRVQQVPPREPPRREPPPREPPRRAPEPEPDEPAPVFHAGPPPAAEPAGPARRGVIARLLRVFLVFMALSALLGIAVTAVNHFAQLGWTLPWLNLAGPPPPTTEGPVRTLSIGNAELVQNGPAAPSRFRTASPILVKLIQTYHWNNGQGRTPGTIAIRASDGRVHGPWRATGQPGAGGVANAYWVVRPEIVVPAGDYEIVVSDPGSWATNASAGNRGFYKMEWQAIRQARKP